MRHVPKIRSAKARSRNARGSAIGSGDATVAGIAAPCRDLVLDRQLQLLEPRNQDFVGLAALRLPIDFGVEAGMLAPQIIDMFAGHLLLHAKLRMLQPERLRRGCRKAMVRISRG